MPVSTVNLMLLQIGEAVQPRQKRRFNPNPSGTIQQGSVTDAVLLFLVASDRFHTEAQIRWKVGRNHGSVSWALVKLRKLGKIDVVEDVSRNSRYFRYRAKRGGDK